MVYQIQGNNWTSGYLIILHENMGNMKDEITDHLCIHDSLQVNGLSDSLKHSSAQVTIET